jgi:hypothetical protein
MGNENSTPTTPIAMPSQSFPRQQFREVSRANKGSGMRFATLFEQRDPSHDDHPESMSSMIRFLEGNGFQYTKKEEQQGQSVYTVITWVC